MAFVKVIAKFRFGQMNVYYTGSPLDTYYLRVPITERCTCIRMVCMDDGTQNESFMTHLWKFLHGVPNWKEHSSNP